MSHPSANSSALLAPSRILLTTTEFDRKQYGVYLHIVFDGLEYLGRLWFLEEETEGDGLPDRTVLPGRTREEVIELAERLRPEDLLQRQARALVDKRRFLGLRRATDDVLHKVRYLNKVALAMKGGLIDMEGAAQEIALTEQQLHELVGQLRLAAGVQTRE